LKGRTLHIVGPEDDYDEEEDNGSQGGEVDPEYDEMVIPEDVKNKREIMEQKKK